MERGIVNLLNQELAILHDLVLSQDCKKESFLSRLTPIEGQNNPTQGYDVFLSEDEAEIILDCMPMPSKDDDQNLVSARVKIQQFLSKSRFGE